MKTSTSQFLTMLDFMEQDGDLNKWADGPYGRLKRLEKWTQLVKLLNMDPTGERKTMEKWKKVWSDFKNNTKRKATKIQKAAVGAIHGPTNQLALSDLELRVLHLIGSQAAPGLIDLEQAGALSPKSVPTPVSTTPFDTKPDLPMLNIEISSSIHDSTEHLPEVECSGAASPQADQSNNNMSQPRSRRRRVFRRRSAWRRFQATEERWRDLFFELATEHLRLREREIEQQAQWQALFARCLNCVELFLK